MVHKALQRKLKIEQHESNNKLEMSSCAKDGTAVPNLIVLTSSDVENCIVTGIHCQYMYDKKLSLCFMVQNPILLWYFHIHVVTFGNIS